MSKSSNDTFVLDLLSQIDHLPAADVAELSQDTIDAVYRTYRTLGDRKRSAALRAFRVGSHVVFPLKSGADVVAVITRVNKKTLGVDQVGGWGSWRVTPSICRPATDEEVKAAKEADASRRSIG